MSPVISRLLAACILAAGAGAAMAQDELEGRYDPELDRFVTGQEAQTETESEGEQSDAAAADEDDALTGSDADEAPAIAAASPPLWLIQDQDTKIHILGAVHLIEPDISWRTPLLEETINSAWLVAFETDTRPQSNSEAAGVYQVYGRLTEEGETLRGLMSEEGAARLAEQAAAFGYSVEKLDALAPWNALIHFAAGYLEANGAQPYADVERSLETTVLLARSELEPFYFSTLTEQLRAYATLEPSVQVAALEASLEDMQAHPDKPRQIAEAWLRGDVETLDALINDGLADDPELKAALYDSRIDTLAEEIGSLLEGPGQTFVTLPAGQLIGQYGLLARLERAGLSVERIGAPEPAAAEVDAAAEPEAEADAQAGQSENTSEHNQAEGAETQEVSSAEAPAEE